MSLLNVKGLSISFGNVHAVQNVNVRVNPGEIVSIIGPNGAGKTTLFNMLSGVYQPSAGEVFFNDLNVTGRQSHELARFGMSRTFQNLQIFDNMTVMENVMAGFHVEHKSHVLLDLLGLGESRQKPVLEKKSIELLHQISLEHLATQSAGSLSYGQQKRLEIARALACQPRLLMLDEPAAGCNAVESREIDEKITEIAKTGIGILLIEHDMKLVMRISNHVIVMDQGTVIAEGTPEQVSCDQNVINAYLGKASDTLELTGV